MHIVRVRMPQMGSSVHESTVVEWKKGVGEAVVRGEVLITAESDKVDFEIEAPANGVLQEIKVNAEETISVGEVLGLIETEEEVAEEAEEEVEAAASPPSSNDDSPPEKAVAPVAPMPRRKRPAPAPKAAAPPEPPPRPMAEGAHSQILSPRVQRLAAEYGLGMDQVSRILGTGAGGRITAKDVKQFVASGGAASAGAGLAFFSGSAAFSGSASSLNSSSESGVMRVGVSGSSASAVGATKTTSVAQSRPAARRVMKFPLPWRPGHGTRGAHASPSRERGHPLSGRISDPAG